MELEIINTMGYNESMSHEAFPSRGSISFPPPPERPLLTVSWGETRLHQGVSGRNMGQVMIGDDVLGTDIAPITRDFVHRCVMAEQQVLYEDGTLRVNKELAHAIVGLLDAIQKYTG